MKTGKLSVVGLGYVGLPLAVLAQEKGWSVSGYDIDARKIEAINKQTSPIKDDALDAALKKYPITVSADPSIVQDSEMIVIAVPTPVTGTNLPDLTPLIGAVEAILPYLVAGQVLSVESTINPGVMDEIVMPLLKEKAAFVHVVHCPERVNPGDPKWTVRNIPRVIGGYSTEGVAQAKKFYESIIEAPLTMMGSATEAEAVKIMENTFRDINIAYINEMAKSFDKLGIDVVNVIKGASTKPFAFMPHYPGNGVGGHCISVDPYYMIERAKQVGFTHHFLKMARKINDSMPAYTISLLKTALKKKKISKKKAVIAFLGLAYKKNVDDLRNSPALVLKKLLENQGFSLKIYDPYIARKSTVDSLEAALSGANIVMLATDHTEFVKTLSPSYLNQKNIQVVIDGKNALDASGIAATDILYHGIGRSRS